MYSVTISFKTKKAFNKFRRNMSNGKCTNIKPSDVTVEGDGIFDTLKSIGKSKITKGIVKALAPSIAGAVQTATGSSTMGAVSQGAINGYTGSGFFDTVKSAANSKITKGIVKSLVPVIANQVQQTTGSNVASAVTKGALTAYAGSGVVHQSDGVALPGTVLPSAQNPNIDLKETMRHRMAKVRSYRKTRGGSVVPLGGR
jgi:hypothetical protein